MSRAISALAVALLWVTQAVAAGDGSDADPYRVPEIDASISVDGVLDESVWDQALALELAYENHPRENAPAEVRTDLYLFSSPTHLYVAFVAEDPDPSRISGNICERDEGMLRGDLLTSFADFWFNYDGPARSYFRLYSVVGREAHAGTEYDNRRFWTTVGYWPTRGGSTPRT